MSAIVSPGAEAQSGRNSWLLAIFALNPQYLDPTDLGPIWLPGICHRIFGVVSAEDDPVTVAQINHHVLAV
jgi:hypothetical protein